MRLDLYLVDKKMADSRTQAQELIAGGHVDVLNQNSWTTVQKASFAVTDAMQVRVSEAGRPLYVSRGGLKMAFALEHLKLNPSNFDVLDVGISTGGFSDCLLQKGARRLVGIDVGHDQLHVKLKNETRLISFEGVNAREFQNLSLEPSVFDLVVVDVSFISLTLILDSLLVRIKPSGFLLALVKPQFELGPQALDKHGIVKDSQLYSDLENKLREVFEKKGLQVLDYFACSILGGDGNQEFFIYAKPQ
jgi:23S rRNA (cytidine1920-2'-O)/16S rRNA (cytidine1409-2'-O)-methyltransferase